MPELPEVETVVRSLAKKLLGKKIGKILVKKWFLLKNIDDIKVSKDEFSSFLENQTLNSISRKGKYIFFMLDEWVVITHLRMTGKFFFDETFDDNKNHESLGFTVFFQDGSKLFFCDSRNFATVQVQKISDYKNLLPYKAIGSDLLNEEIDNDKVYRHFSSKKTFIKISLLQQNVISGIGNIYASEILFLSKLSPFSMTNKISAEEYDKIFYFSKEIMKKSVEMKGCSISDFLNPFGEAGSYQSQLMVYGRAGFDCKVCLSSKIEKSYIDNRSTFFCKNCQSLIS